MERSERFGLVLSMQEKIALAQLAQIEGGLSQAAELRRLIRRAAKDRGLWPPIGPHLTVDGRRPGQRKGP